jgi:hypothetical protein
MWSQNLFQWLKGIAMNNLRIMFQLEGLVDELAKQLKNVENELKQLKEIDMVKQQAKRNM